MLCFDTTYSMGEKACRKYNCCSVHLFSFNVPLIYLLFRPRRHAPKTGAVLALPPPDTLATTPPTSPAPAPIWPFLPTQAPAPPAPPTPAHVSATPRPPAPASPAPLTPGPICLLALTIGGVAIVAWCRLRSVRRGRAAVVFLQEMHEGHRGALVRARLSRERAERLSREREGASVLIRAWARRVLKFRRRRRLAAVAMLARRAAAAARYRKGVHAVVYVQALWRHRRRVAVAVKPPPVRWFPSSSSFLIPVPP